MVFLYRVSYLSICSIFTFYLNRCYTGSLNFSQNSYLTAGRLAFFEKSMYNVYVIRLYGHGNGHKIGKRFGTSLLAVSFFDLPWAPAKFQ